MSPIAGTASDAAAAIATIETPNGRAVAIDRPIDWVISDMEAPSVLNIPPRPPDF
nr:hypothetical protein [Mycobacteroides abscessus]